MDDYTIKRWVNPAQHFDENEEIIWEIGGWGKPLPVSSIGILEVAKALDSLCDMNGFSCACEYDCCGHQFSSGATVMLKDDEVAYIRMSIGFSY
jgi:hypothetical protein